MIGIAFVALMIFLGPVLVMVIDKDAPVLPDHSNPAPYYGPSRRVYEIAKALG